MEEKILTSLIQIAKQQGIRYTKRNPVVSELPTYFWTAPLQTMCGHSFCLTENEFYALCTKLNLIVRQQEKKI